CALRKLRILITWIIWQRAFVKNIRPIHLRTRDAFRAQIKTVVMGERACPDVKQFVGGGFVGYPVYKGDMWHGGNLLLFELGTGKWPRVRALRFRYATLH